MRSPALSWIAGLVVLAAASVAAAAVFSASTTSLSIGTSFEVDGSAFARPAKAWLVVGNRKLPLKVERGATESHLVATLAKVPKNVHGPCTLNVRAAGTKVPSQLVGFTLQLPAAASVLPLNATIGDEIVIRGLHFGTKRGTVQVEGKVAKVISWSTTEIRAVVPKRVAGGLNDIVVSNRTGRSVNEPSQNDLL